MGILILLQKIPLVQLYRPQAVLIFLLGVVAHAYLLAESLKLIRIHLTAYVGIPKIGIIVQNNRFLTIPDKKFFHFHPTPVHQVPQGALWVSAVLFRPQHLNQLAFRGLHISVRQKIRE